MFFALSFLLSLQEHVDNDLFAYAEACEDLSLVFVGAEDVVSHLVLGYGLCAAFVAEGRLGLRVDAKLYALMKAASFLFGVLPKAFLSHEATAESALGQTGMTRFAERCKELPDRVPKFIFLFKTSQSLRDVLVCNFVLLRDSYNRPCLDGLHVPP